MPAKRSCKRLTAYQKGQIEGRRGSMSHGEMSRELGIPRPTISTFLKRLDDRESIENIHPPGRPRKTSTASDRYIVHTAESETRVPLAKLRHITNVPISE